MDSPAATVVIGLQHTNIPTLLCTVQRLPHPTQRPRR